MGINGWSFSKERCTQIVLLYVRPEGFSSLSSQILDFRDPVQIYVANSVSRENAPEVPSQKERDPSEEILYLHHFGTALRGGKGSCRADFSTGRLRHSRHSALPSRTWWNVFLIGNAKISGHLPLPRSYIFPLFLQILLPGRKCVIWR